MLLYNPSFDSYSVNFAVLRNIGNAVRGKFRFSSVEWHAKVGAKQSFA